MTRVKIDDKVELHGPFWKPGKWVTCFVKEVYKSHYGKYWMLKVADSETGNIYRVRPDELHNPKGKYLELRRKNVKITNGRLK